ncbi:alanine racemase [Cupriavidus basilensis]|uniref:Alanine racemase n=1 Tax=Cupriavidus basilensis TaxID=68895 RepID=A0ABT6AS34_9BURK|nr:alanine racemase [Cupriavidus basilensis]MDF3835062.1 alanine racemase [Cupriavidus basilensis]
MESNAWFEVDLDKFEANVRGIQALIGPRTEMCAVMKADACGHGMALLVASAIALGVASIGIASNEEAEIVRHAGFRGRLLRVRAATPVEIEDGLQYRLEEIAGNLEYAHKMNEIAGRRGRSVRVHLELNSGGMSRNGFDLKAPEERRKALAAAALANLEVVGIMTHFPVCDVADVERGLASFREEAGWIVENAGLDRARVQLHCANSFATLEVPGSHLDMVRTGAILYGCMPAYPAFQAIASLKSRVASVNAYPAGNTVAYDRTLTLERDSRLANIPIGYADGYRRAFSNKGFALIRGKRFPVVGRVTMNTLMVDVTACEAVFPGDEVVLCGRQGDGRIDVADIEAISGTIYPDLCVGWGNSVSKIATRSGQPGTGDALPASFQSPGR